MAQFAGFPVSLSSRSNERFSNQNLAIFRRPARCGASSLGCAARPHDIGSTTLLLGHYAADDGKLIYAGRAGTGMPSRRA
jgi:hypothetical protein